MKAVSELKGKDQDSSTGSLVSRDLSALIYRFPDVLKRIEALGFLKLHRTVPAAHQLRPQIWSRCYAIATTAQSQTQSTARFEIGSYSQGAEWMISLSRCVSCMDRRGECRNCLFHAGLGSSGPRRSIATEDREMKRLGKHKHGGF